jgi:glycosyltransferase involved in cell wall biosynthesis
VRKLNILVELRPALDGYAGIPQESRLLFSGLADNQDLNIEGLIQSSMEFLPVTPSKLNSDKANHVYIDAYSKLILAIEKNNNAFKLKDYLKRRWAALKLTITSVALPNKNIIVPIKFNPKGFEDFVWRKFFSKTLPPSLFARVTSRHMQIISIPWGVFHMIGLWTKRFLGHSRYPNVAMSETDIFIAQTPFPGKLINDTKLVIRYHDAVPIFLPHTIGNMVKHQANHYEALKANVEAGAYFACVSETTRSVLLEIFPELAQRAVTIENMLSHHFFPVIEESPEHVSQIISSRCRSTNSNLNNTKILFNKSDKYLLMVSTIEPRKNHEILLDAWECLKIEYQSDAKLVLVGNPGWNSEALLERMSPWIASGDLILLSGVPADELRVLYRNAALTVCPSVAEGFDYSGVESMSSGGIVIASDIKVHREIYKDAAEYFSTYDSKSLVDKLRILLSDDQETTLLKSDLRRKGLMVSERYTARIIMPKWTDFLNRIMSPHTKSGIN